MVGDGRSSCDNKRAPDYQSNLRRDYKCIFWEEDNRYEEAKRREEEAKRREAYEKTHPVKGSELYEYQMRIIRELRRKK
ncbi:MAG: hypothetical protein LBI14_01875 [Treponema sp.]|nr:hypothetical protein [Treponema sp.]